MMTIEHFGRRLRARDITAVRVIEDCLARIEADNARLNAFILVLADDALRQAREADRELAAGHDRGPLHGVPISIKDLIDMRGVPTTAASRVREGHVADHDAPTVAHLRQAGAVIVGKTNLHEFAFGTTSEDSAFGAAHNPHDSTTVAGRIERRLGRQRRRAGWPSPASAPIPADRSASPPPRAASSGSSLPSATCRLTASCRYRARWITSDRSRKASRTPASSITRCWETTPWRRRRPMPLIGLRLAVPRTYFCDVLDDEVRARFDEAIDRLRSAGAHVDEVEIRHAADIAKIYLHLVLGDAAAYHATTLDTMPEKYTPAVRVRLEMGRYVLAEDYVRALAGREVLRREVDAALALHDALVLPTLAIPAPAIGADSVQIGARSEPVRNVMLRLTQLFNVTGHPAISLPDGYTSGGLPCALQLVGYRMQTDALLKVALACEFSVTGASLRSEV